MLCVQDVCHMVLIISQYHQIPYLQGKQLTNWKIIISQRFFCRIEFSEHHLSLLSLGVWHQKEDHQSIWLWRPVGFKCRSSTELGEEILYSWKMHTSSDPGQSSDFTVAWTGSTHMSCRVSCDTRVGCGSLRAKILVIEAPGNIHEHELSKRSQF